MDWQEISGNWILVPNQPIAIIHFLGGAFVATAPQLTYRRLLECLANQGYVVIATPFVNTFDHVEIARSVLGQFEQALQILRSRTLQNRYLPIYGMGHSLGCKLHLLIGSVFPVERAGNILISYNNYSARDAVPLVEQFSQFLSPQVFSVEFTPSPLETTQMVRDRYQVRRNLVIKFSNDTLDQTLSLAAVLEQKFPNMVVSRRLIGSHLTPLGPDLKWQTGQIFTPFDAIGQWMRQELYRELQALEQDILLWLDPLRHPK
ncbi:DUF1350 family protein [Myxacorys almedinensis]|uniref:DUF1350 domain-containing protein n=1 Tax=Myxacorys almedinensis A TaxID=2690445 RepID=A0A8J7Z223_9CYAN|nr:DUF1350 family protein [Myxacorys almedinensis]NDJ18614.1 DUF1350 domain-containing protein [Myxacorys almedinensis A]